MGRRQHGLSHLAKLRVEINEEKSRFSRKGAWRPNYKPKLKKRTALLGEVQGCVPAVRQPTGGTLDQTG